MGSAKAPDIGTANVQNHTLCDAELRTYIITHIDEAVEKGWIKPFYQPVIRSLTGYLCGYEALARWDDPTYGLLSPAAFIPVLEEEKLIHLLDCSIIRQVCRHLNERNRIGAPIVPVSLNLSRLDFDLCDIFSVVEGAVFEFGVPRRMLNIEVTESVLGADTDYMKAMICRFHDAGYEVWMDDFGSGYSTLNVLKDFEFDELKIDMAFLSTFNEKSKTVLASVVDMAKKLGVRTLAEGVETEEHRDFLRGIGCEKMQGYLFGKPAPYDLADPPGRLAGFGIERISECQYLDEMGAVNTLSLSEHDLVANTSMKSYTTNMPIAIIEYYDDTFRIVESNEAFSEGLARLGVSSPEVAEHLANDPSRLFARQTRHMMRNIAETKVARFDYAVGNAVCVIRARYITSRNGKIALILSFGDTVAQSDQRRHERMSNLLSAVYSIYDLVDIIHLDERFIEPVFDNIRPEGRLDILDFDSVVNYFANTGVYVDDRQRYLEFMDHDTMVERLANCGEGYLIGFFRLRQSGGNYAWHLFSLMYLADQPGNQVMLCIRRTHWQSDEVLHAAFGKHQDGGSNSLRQSTSSITDGSLWRAMTRGKFARVFWKDTERRFVGANQAFLDFYGFNSVDDIVGKTDEDMGWHINPTPFQSDEMDVLREGAYVENVRGHCIAQGEVRDIIVSKYPIYRNGHIVGLVGFFLNAPTGNLDDPDTVLPSMRDDATDALNYMGLEAATWKHVDTYKRQGIDFAMISINIDNFEEINAAFGSELGDKVLKRIADELFKVAGHQRVVGHIFANRFVILMQGLSDEELQGVCDEIERSIRGIAHVDGIPVTIYALAGFARFSKHGDIEAMKKHNRDGRIRRRENWAGKKGEADIITSSLI